VHVRGMRRAVLASFYFLDSYDYFRCAAVWCYRPGLFIRELTFYCVILLYGHSFDGDPGGSRDMSERILMIPRNARVALGVGSGEGASL